MRVGRDAGIRRDRTAIARDDRISDRQGMPVGGGILRIGGILSRAVFRGGNGL